MGSEKRRTLSADDWSEPALRAIALGGLGAVAVEKIAKEIGTSKGSFYWHFADRDALIAAALERWENRHTDGVIASVEPEPTVERRLRALLRLALSSVPDGESSSVELALLAHATHPLVKATLLRVTRRRLDYVTSLFVELGFTPSQAHDRGLLAYSAFLGQAQLARATPGLLPQGRAFSRYINRSVDALMANPDGMTRPS